MNNWYISNKLRGSEVISLNPQYLPIKNSLYKTFVTFVFLARFPNAYVIIRRLITLRTGSKAQEHRLAYDKKIKTIQNKTKKKTVFYRDHELGIG